MYISDHLAIKYNFRKITHIISIHTCTNSFPLIAILFFLCLTGVLTMEFETESNRPFFFQLTIQVTDINDNPPQFSSAEYSFLTVESYDVNTNIGEVRAVDSDSGVNGDIVYTIVSVDPAPRTQGGKSSPCLIYSFLLCYKFA